MLFSQEEISKNKNIAEAGDRAVKVLNGADWAWINETIFKALEDEAIEVLKRAKDDTDRLKAQQMFLACHKPREIIYRLIQQGDGAREMLRQISTQEGE